MLELARHPALDDAECQTLDNGAFAHAGFADEHGVVLLAARENLGETLDLGVAAHHGVEASVGGGTCHVVAEFIEHGCVGLASAGTLWIGALFALLSAPFGVGVSACHVAVAVIVAVAVGHIAVVGHEAAAQAVVGYAGVEERAYERELAHFLVVEEREQQVLGVDKRCLEVTCLQDGQFED